MQVHASADLPLTGERTVPGLDRENYWFRRHEIAYEWVADTFAAQLTDAVVVDAGSGEGYGCAMLRDRGAAQVIALEFDQTTAGHAGRTYPDVSVVRANLDSLPLRDHGADMIVTLQVIEHLWDLRGFLRDCLRVLRPGGLLIAATPNRLTFSPGLGRGQKPTNPFHVEEFDAAQIIDLLAEAGFRDATIWCVRHRSHVRPGLVADQIAAVQADCWPAELVREVAAITVADFEVSPTGVADGLDLIGVARAPA